MYKKINLHIIDPVTYTLSACKCQRATKRTIMLSKQDTMGLAQGYKAI